MPIPAIGAKAPAIDLPSDGGGRVSLAQFAGQKVVVYFYPKDDTSGCTKEAMDFNRLKGEFAAAGTQIIGISTDSVSSHDKFKKKHGLELALGADEERQVVEAYGVWTEKSMYGRKYMGIERTTVLIDGAGNVARVWEKVKVPGHAEEVLTAAKAL